MPKAAPHSPKALSSIASNTRARLPNDELITCKTSTLAVCCSRVSFSSRVRIPICFCRLATDGAAIDALRAFLFARGPLTGLSLPPRRLIFASSGGDDEAQPYVNLMLRAMPERPLRVKLRRTQCEQMSSGLPLKADIPRYRRHVSKVPDSDSRCLFGGDFGGATEAVRG